MVPTLHFLSGKIAAGKTTLARRIAREAAAVLVCEDVWLAALFPEEIVSFEDYLSRSRRFRSVAGPHIQALLRCGSSVVLDFAGNVPAERAWVRGLAEAAPSGLLLHYIEASDNVCKHHLQGRNVELPVGAQYTTEEEFDAIAKYFVAPDPNEGIPVRVYEAGRLPDRIFDPAG